MAIAKLKSWKYRVTIDIQGIQPYSKTFSLKKHAQAWQKRQLDDIEAARAYGQPAGAKAHPE